MRLLVGYDDVVETDATRSLPKRNSKCENRRLGRQPLEQLEKKMTPDLVAVSGYG
jgi:hypothetical protein